MICEADQLRNPGDISAVSLQNLASLVLIVAISRIRLLFETFARWSEQLVPGLCPLVDTLTDLFHTATRQHGQENKNCEQSKTRHVSPKK